METELEPAPATLPSAGEFLMTVNMHAHLERLPEGSIRRHFVEELTEQAAGDDPLYTLDYCRPNISARRPEEV